MHKLAVVSQWWFDRGGTEVLAANLAREFAAVGMDVRLVYLDVADRSTPERPGMLGDVIPISQWSGAMRTLHDWGADDVLLLSDLRNGLTDALSRVRARFRRTIYLNANNEDVAFAAAHPAVRGPLVEMLSRFDGIATFFESAQSTALLRSWQVPHRVIRTGIPIPPPADGLAFRRRIGASASEQLVLCVGLVVPLKQQVELLQALPARAGRRLVFIGDIYPGTAEYGARFHAAIAARPDAQWLGGIPRSEVLDAMAGCDVLVFPSLSEGAPLVLLEAMASGLPWVTTPAIDLAGELTGGVRQPLHRFEAAVDLLLGDPRVRATVAREGRAAFANAWHLRATAHAFRQWFTEARAVRQSA
ncbi:MAG: glycosyltransferase family 4 protein [Gemmatimonadaceae bacterium]|nr:glycosyltransferase family 4 protein [Gemmatimonadaceae bacterium]